MAKGNEQPRPALAQPAPARGWNPLWLLLAVPLLLLLGGLVGHLLTRGHSDEHKPVAKNHSDQPPPGRDAGDGSLTKLLPPPVKETQKWEYKVVALQPLGVKFQSAEFARQAAAVTDLFNKLAQDGWEYNSPLLMNNLNANFLHGYVIFKRAKRSRRAGTSRLIEPTGCGSIPASSSATAERERSG